MTEPKKNNYRKTHRSNKSKKHKKTFKIHHELKYITDRDEWENNRIFISVLNKYYKNQVKYGAELVDIKPTGWGYENSKHYRKGWYFYIRMKMNSKYVFLRLTPRQRDSIFHHMAHEIRTDPNIFFNLLGDLGSREKDRFKRTHSHSSSNENIRRFEKIKDTKYRGLDVYEGPLFLGYLVDYDSNPYEEKLKDSKVYLDVLGWFIANTRKNGYITCNPKKYSKKLDDGEKVKFISQCYIPERTKQHEYLFLDLKTAMFNDTSIYMSCDTSKAWRRRVYYGENPGPY